jgi:hypothetical protein
MVKRVKLDIKPEAFSIVGISSHENDYRLSWSINEQMNLSFAQNNCHETAEGKEFSCFVHEDDDQTVMLVSNRCENGFLLEKYKNFDFFLKFYPELDESKTSEWLRNLKKVPLISTVISIPVTKTVMKLLG